MQIRCTLTFCLREINRRVRTSSPYHRAHLTSDRTYNCTPFMYCTLIVVFGARTFPVRLKSYPCPIFVKPLFSRLILPLFPPSSTSILSQHRPPTIPTLPCPNYFHYRFTVFTSRSPFRCNHRFKRQLLQHCTIRLEYYLFLPRLLPRV